MPALRAALAAGGKAIWGVQLRLKSRTGVTADAKTYRHASAALRPIIIKAGAKFILNDRAELVAATKADGVHLGQDDMPLRAARAQTGARAIIGITCHNKLALAHKATAHGADYIAFGAFHASSTKAVIHHAHARLLQQWRAQSQCPCVAIGGITAENAPPLVAAGAQYLAVSSAIWQHRQGAGAAVQAFLQTLTHPHLAEPA